MKAKRLAQAKKEGQELNEEDEAAAADMLAGEDDDEVIF